MSVEQLTMRQMVNRSRRTFKTRPARKSMESLKFSKISSGTKCAHTLN